MTVSADSGKHEAIRIVVDSASEVRVHLHDKQVIFGSIARVAVRKTESFRIKPWGLKVPREILFADVAGALPVKQMGWAQYRAIGESQLAGVFANQPKVGK